MVSKDLILGVLLPETLLSSLEVGHRLVGPPRSENTVLVVPLAWDGRRAGLGRCLHYIAPTTYSLAPRMNVIVCLVQAMYIANIRLQRLSSQPCNIGTSTESKPTAMPCLRGGPGNNRILSEPWVPTTHPTHIHSACVHTLIIKAMS